MPDEDGNPYIEEIVAAGQAAVDAAVELARQGDQQREKAGDN